MALALVALGAGIAWDRWQHGGAQELAWRDVTADFRHLRWPRHLGRTFSSRAALVREVRRLFPSQRPALPPFDFERERLVLAAAGPRSSTGYGVQIVEVVERRGAIDAYVREVTPGLRDRVEARVTFPFRMFAIPERDKRVYVHWEGRP